MLGCHLGNLNKWENTNYDNDTIVVIQGNNEEFIIL